ncbi:gpW family head-tail joining protein [Pseudophaeobacter sp.]|jgi:hypothetical protein|uniref:gpW family head-tail joining protein n=1 Tax=Pseudophaeobacter sp. TaxID=1971739 RepID=UPI00326339AE
MSIDRAELEAKLAKFEAALENLLLGDQAIKVDYEGLGTEFARPTEAGLRRQIRALKRQLGIGGSASRRVCM